MYILSFFTTNGLPATGLSTPTIKIREIPAGTILVNEENMTEVGDGFYYYEFTTYDPTKLYAIRCDGTVELPDAERYQHASNDSHKEEIADEVLDEVVTDHNTSGSVGETLRKIMWKSR